MKQSICIWLAVLSGPAIACAQQKPVLDTASLHNWEYVRSGAISPDGKYASYIVYTDYSRPGKMFVKSLQGNWKFAADSAKDLSFSDNGKTAFFIHERAGLGILQLGSSRQAAYIPEVTAFRTVKAGDSNWLTYRVASNTIFRNQQTGREIVFANTEAYWPLKDGLLLLTDTTVRPQVLKKVNLSNGAAVKLWEGEGFRNGSLKVDDKSGQFAFIAQKSIYQYKSGGRVVQLPVMKEMNGLELEGIDRFSNDGRRLFFVMNEPAANKPAADPDAVKVDVWSYMDTILQSEQILSAKGGDAPFMRTTGYTAVVNLDNGQVIRLNRKGERFSLYDGKSDDIAMATSWSGNGGERFWNAGVVARNYLVNTHTGERKAFDMREVAINTCFSAGGRYLICMKSDWHDYYSYEIATGTLRNLTESLQIPPDSDYDEPANAGRPGMRLVGWFEGERYILLSDSYDLWKLDVRQETPPVNLTNGYGRKHNIRFNLTGGYLYRTKSIADKGKQLLCAFNETTKQNGFFHARFDKAADPEQLIMSDHMYVMPDYPRGLPDQAPVKAENAAVWLVSRESAAESANYFWTKDFKTFTPVSDVYPEKRFNWMTSELINFTTVDGRPECGVLYKPENFNPSRKYPVIVHYYEKLAHRKNVYEKPEAMGDNLNIPWFVSRGSLVFTPDIRYTLGEPGESALNSVLAAGKHMAALPYVDAARIGIQGHSWGGYQTQYIVGRTDFFAAAMASSGPSDFISGYGAIAHGGQMSLQFFYEESQCRIGPNMWERPDLYIKNTAVFNANKVTTPLLMMNNKEDGIVPFAQGVELFTALRRLGRRAWMLQYDGETHCLLDDKVKKQHAIRVTQFFDHYLKGMPAPKWMTRGIPAAMKGVNDGLALDHEISTPGPGLLKEDAVASE